MLIAAEPPDFAGFSRADGNRAISGTKCRCIVNGVESAEDWPTEHDNLLHRVKHWSLPTLREKLIKIGAEVVAHSRYAFFQTAEVAIPRGLFLAILRRTERLRLPETVPQ